MQHQEKARIVRCGNQNGEIFGQIKLQHMADPTSVVVHFCGKRLYPKEFTVFGDPIFTKEVCDFFDWKEKALQRKHGKNYRLTTLVIYSDTKKVVDLLAVDCIYGIMKRIEDLQSLNQLLINRSFYSKQIEQENKVLGEYVIFGRYWLDRYGQVWTLSEECEDAKIKAPEVCLKSKFTELYEKNKEQGKNPTWKLECHIPQKGERCPWCTRKFTIYDVKKGRFDVINGKIAHRECAKEYEHEKEIDRIINQIVEFVYGDEITFELLPNKYCNKPCCAHIPWFLCHTPDGDIEIGWRKRVISIEWKENFKPFDMSIFDDENVTKWNRGIHAEGMDKAYDYLQKVKKIVNP